ncbi:GAP family protein [Nocardioides euryhalodurans]|uniref:GAP family protein n=1 Tax=Nocardioides euryhalodurans TaxID=2518370 RepID=A0A4P7GGG2_9ACTN|nr:GAP family protein [Nocardioides euryhalodurans]QBR90915.1 hypothetical protein EXE57_00500 [Nocardioides euryhalodurans]
MLHLLIVVLPLGLAAAVSPVMVTEQAVLLAGPRGRRTAALYAAGTGTVLAGLVGAVLLLGRSLSLPRAPQLDASLDLLIGGLLLALAAVLGVWHPGRRRTKERSHRPLTPAGAFAFGAFSMATNVTTLALVVPAAKEIAASPLAVWEHVTAALLLVGVVCLPAWGPVALTSVAPGPASRLLARMQRLIDRHGRLLVTLLIVAAGGFFVVRGILRLAGL